MKLKHKTKNLRPTKDFSFQRYFNISSSPHTRWRVNENGFQIIDYTPKNVARRDRPAYVRKSQNSQKDS